MENYLGQIFLVLSSVTILKKQFMKVYKVFWKRLC